MDATHAVIRGHDQDGAIEYAGPPICLDDVAQGTVETLHKEPLHVPVLGGEVSNYVGLREIDHHDTRIPDAVKGP